MLEPGEYIQENFNPELPPLPDETSEHYISCWKFDRIAQPAPTIDPTIKAAVWLPSNDLRLHVHARGYIMPRDVPVVAVSLGVRRRVLRPSDDIWYAGHLPFEKLREFERPNMDLARMAIERAYLNRTLQQTIEYLAGEFRVDTVQSSRIV